MRVEFPLVVKMMGKNLLWNVDPNDSKMSFARGMDKMARKHYFSFRMVVPV